MKKEEKEKLIRVKLLQNLCCSVKQTHLTLQFAALFLTTTTLCLLLLQLLLLLLLSVFVWLSYIPIFLSNFRFGRSPKISLLELLCIMMMMMILDAEPSGDHRVQVWWRSSHLSASRIAICEMFTDGRTDGQTDGRRTPRDCISSWNELIIISSRINSCFRWLWLEMRRQKLAFVKLKAHATHNVLS